MPSASGIGRAIRDDWEVELISEVIKTRATDPIEA